MTDAADIRLLCEKKSVTYNDIQKILNFLASVGAPLDIQADLRTIAIEDAQTYCLRVIDELQSSELPDNPPVLRRQNARSYRRGRR